MNEWKLMKLMKLMNGITWIKKNEWMKRTKIYLLTLGMNGNEWMNGWMEMETGFRIPHEINGNGNEMKIKMNMEMEWMIEWMEMNGNGNGWMDGNANGGCISDPYFHKIRIDDEYEIDRSGLMRIIGN